MTRGLEMGYYEHNVLRANRCPIMDGQVFGAFYLDF